MKANTSKRINFYTQGKQFTARALFTVCLLASGSPESILATPKRQMVPATPTSPGDPSLASAPPTPEGILQLPPDSPGAFWGDSVASSPSIDAALQERMGQEAAPDEGSDLLRTSPKVSPVEENWTFQARGGERVRFSGQQGQWCAEVSSRIGAFHRHLVIPVVCLQGVDVASSLEVLYKYPIWYSQRQIHVLGENVCPTLGKVVYVGELGLRGGWLGRRARSKSTAERDQVTQDCQNAAAEDSNNPTIVTTQRGGLYRFFIIDGIPYRSIAGLVCIGLAQIAAGCFLTSYPLGEKVSKISKVSNF